MEYGEYYTRRDTTWTDADTDSPLTLHPDTTRSGRSGILSGTPQPHRHERPVVGRIRGHRPQSRSGGHHQEVDSQYKTNQADRGSRLLELLGSSRDHGAILSSRRHHTDEDPNSATERGEGPLKFCDVEGNGGPIN